MVYFIRNLILYQPLVFCLPAENEECGPDMHYKEKLTVYTSGVRPGTLEPEKKEHLNNGIFSGYEIPATAENGRFTLIPAGAYLFTQGLYCGFETMLDAAEELWLESLWTERSFTGQTVYVRQLEEEGQAVFQLFRPVSE